MTDLCSSDITATLTLNEALAKIKTSITPVSGSEQLSLTQALGRISAEPIDSANNIPAFTNSSMDGYALHSDDILENSPFTLKIFATSRAGRPVNGGCPPGHCVRIFTGAALPDPTNTVIMQEQVSRHGDSATFPSGLKAGQNIRHIGEDIRQGEQLIPAAKKLTAIDLGLLASAGVYLILVKPKLRIAFFSTGDELTAIGKALQPGQIYDSNRYSLYGLLQDHCFDVADLGVLPDDKQRIKDRLLQLAQTYDVIISTGGASVGEADYIKQILDEIGSVNFWKVAVKPGKPFAFGKIGDCYFFGLPGNPVSVIATFHHLVLPALQQLSGTKLAAPLRLAARSKDNLKKEVGRMEFQRGMLTQLENGELLVESAGKQASNILSSMSKANCYIVLPAECGGIASGDWVEVEPFQCFG